MVPSQGAPETRRGGKSPSPEPPGGTRRAGSWGPPLAPGTGKNALLRFEPPLAVIRVAVTESCRTTDPSQASASARLASCPFSANRAGWLVTFHGTEAVAGRVGSLGSSRRALTSRSSGFRGVRLPTCLRPPSGGPPPLPRRPPTLGTAAARTHSFSKRQMAQLIRSVAHACHPAYASKRH